MNQTIFQTKVQKKIETIYDLLNLIKNYKPIYGNEDKEANRLRHFRDCICEDITYIVEARIKGEK